MLTIAWRLQTAAVLCLMAGCAVGSPPPCKPAGAPQNATLDRDHAARVGAEEEPAQSRSPGEKGPSPEGVEAIALLEKQILDDRAKDCAPNP